MKSESSKNNDKLYRAANREKILAYQKEWREKNKIKVATQKKEWYENNLEHRKEYDRIRKSIDPEYGARKKREQYARNPHPSILRARNREADLKKRVPRWANTKLIEEIYRDAAEFRAAGLDVHVDHIIPLRAKLASGLHVHQNLTIKLATWNDSKGNKYVL